MNQCRRQDRALQACISASWLPPTGGPAVDHDQVWSEPGQTADRGLDMAIRVCEAGASGKTGGEVARAILASHDFDLTGAIARRNVGRDVGELLGLPGNGIVVAGTLEEALARPTDVRGGLHQPWLGEGPHTGRPGPWRAGRDRHIGAGFGDQAGVSVAFVLERVHLVQDFGTGFGGEGALLPEVGQDDFLVAVSGEGTPGSYRWPGRTGGPRLVPGCGCPGSWFSPIGLRGGIKFPPEPDTRKATGFAVPFQQPPGSVRRW